MEGIYKFRGKATNGEWVYGNFIQCCKSDGYIGTIGKVRGREVSLNAELIDNLSTVGQYIELRDINAKEIYEKDFIEFEYEGKKYIGEVKYEIGIVIVTCRELPDTYLPIGDILDTDCREYWVNGEIVGNSIDNPELGDE